MEILEIISVCIILLTIFLAIADHYMLFLKSYIMQIFLILCLFLYLFSDNFVHDYILLGSFVLSILIRLIAIPYLINYFMIEYYIKKSHIAMTQRTFKISYFYLLLIHIGFLICAYYLSDQIFQQYNLIFITSLFILFSGLLNFINHTKLIGDILSFLEIENAIFLFSLLIIEFIPIYIEIGIIIDITMSLLILLISVIKIKEILGHTRIEKLNNLKN